MDRPSPSLIEETIKNLEKNGFSVFYFEKSSDAVTAIIEKLKTAVSISRSGSATIEEIGLIDKVIQMGLPFRDYKSKEDRIASVTAEYYLTSTNSISKDGKLVNIDGTGNRVAAMSFGPRQVFVVAGTNKLAEDEASALSRVRNIAAPLNTKRLNRKTPCAKTGKCEDCTSPERICRKLLVLEKPEPGRVSIFLINEDLGY